ncbi:hypothetical protein H920_03982 [Fukomys damarensis]|uniref:Uncharacterized protein n=1 Tax=Fukomys damarensis TaxID=885580 RepID=A0A091DR39_FUKDA|nr:hypothetical protein H920_03982 [Fukomys damarensis]
MGVGALDNWNELRLPGPGRSPLYSTSNTDQQKVSTATAASRATVRGGARRNEPTAPQGKGRNKRERESPSVTDESDCSPLSLGFSSYLLSRWRNSSEPQKSCGVENYLWVSELVQAGSSHHSGSQCVLVEPAVTWFELPKAWHLFCSRQDAARKEPRCPKASLEKARMAGSWQHPGVDRKTPIKALPAWGLGEWRDGLSELQPTHMAICTNPEGVPVECGALHLWLGVLLALGVQRPVFAAEPRCAEVQQTPSGALEQPKACWEQEGVSQCTQQTWRCFASDL